MICKFCNAEIEGETQQCPVCGKLLTEEVSAESVQENAVQEEIAPQKLKSRVLSRVMAICGAVVGLCLLLFLLLTALGVKWGSVIDSLTLNFKTNDMQCKKVYTVSDEKVISKADVVVAAVEDVELTNAQLQIYYRSATIDYLNNNYNRLEQLNLDLAKPLAEQVSAQDETLSWEKYFLKNALETWHRYTALRLLAKQEGFAVSDAIQTLIDELPHAMEDAAASGGYANVDEWLLENYGPGVTQTDVIRYMEDYYVGTAYLQSRYEELVPTEEDIQAYYTEHEAELTENGITKESGKYYDVRHILIEIEGGTEDENGKMTYTDADWEACRVKAQTLLDQWAAGDATEQSFAELAVQHSTDPGSSSNGGLYSQLTKETNFVEPFKAWYLDESRKAGDTGLVRTDYGYHIMYFSASEDIWHYVANTQLVTEQATDMILKAKESFEIEVNYRKIVLADMELAG